MSTPANEDRLKKLLKSNMSIPMSSPTPSPVEVNVGGYISPIANIKVVGVGGG